MIKYGVIDIFNIDYNSLVSLFLCKTKDIYIDFVFKEIVQF